MRINRQCKDKAVHNLIIFSMILIIIFLVSGCSNQEIIKQSDKSNTDIVKEVDCPYGIHDEAYPGSCGWYRDEDNNGLCDLSE